MWSRYSLTKSDVSTDANDVFKSPGLNMLYGPYHTQIQKPKKGVINVGVLLFRRLC